MSHEKISQLEMTIHDLNIDLESKSAALQAATMEVVSLREELRAQRSGAKELAARYQAQCDAAAAEAKRAGALSDRVRALQEQLDANNATCDDLRRQVAAAAADSAAEVTPKKAVKKVKKKKTAEEDGVDATSTAVAEDGARLQEMRADYEGRLAALTAQIADLERAARTAEHALGSQAGEIATQNASSSIAILSLEQSLADVKDRSKEDLELLLAKVQKLEGLAAVAEAEFRSKYAALTERNETLQEESLLLCQQLAKKETECEELVDEGKRAAMLKDAKIAELSNKLTTLTEKAKDYVKKFSEAKAQIVSIEDANRKLSEELAQTYSAKVIFFALF